MARVTKTLCYSIEEALKKETNSGQLTELKLIFQDLLLPDLDNENFADMYAQTIAYSLFTVRIGHSDSSPLTPLLTKEGVEDGGFNRENASYYISDKIPFLKGLFDTIISTNIFSKIHWTIDILIELLANVDMDNILENFGKETRKEDPVVHFTELLNLISTLS